MQPRTNVSAEATNTSDLVIELQKQNKAFAGQKGANYGNPGDPRIILASIIKMMLSFVGMIFLFYTIYGGYLIMTAVGKEDRITKGRSIISHGVFGVVVMLAAYSITVFIAGIALSTQTQKFGKTTQFQWGILPNSGGFYNTDVQSQDTSIFEYPTAPKMP